MNLDSLPTLLARAALVSLVVGTSSSYLTANEFPKISTAAIGQGKSDSEQVSTPRTIVLFCPGLDGQAVERLMQAGHLPNLAALREQGSYSRITPMQPCDETVSWLALNTGTGPRKTGVPGFIKLQRENRFGAAFGHIDFTDASLSSLGISPPPDLDPQLLDLEYPVARNLAAGKEFWNVAAEQGVSSMVLRAGMAFDRPAAPGARVLAGEGYMDASTALGNWFIYSSDPVEFNRPPLGRDSPTAGTVFRVDVLDNHVSTRLFGPSAFGIAQELKREIEAVDLLIDDESTSYEETDRLYDRRQELNEKLAEAKRKSLPLEVDLEQGVARVTIAGQTQEVPEHTWSDTFHLQFPVGLGLQIHATTRVKLLQASSPFRLYVDSLDVDPSMPPYWRPLSQPPGFAAELAEQCGTFDTYGWGASATMGFKDGELDYQTLLEDIEYTLENGFRLIETSFMREDWQLLAGSLRAADSLQHMSAHIVDDQHPLFDSAYSSGEVKMFGKSMPRSQAVDAVYQRIDMFVGELVHRLSTEDTLLVISPFGFDSARRQVDLNSWLAENGFLSIKESSLEKGWRRYGLNFVDWSGTRAFALGLGGIHINAVGRDPHGIVSSDEVSDLVAELRDALLAGKDLETGEPFVTEVTDFTSSSSDLPPDHMPDLVVGFASGYRIAWVTTGGGIQTTLDEAGMDVPGPVISPNENLWSGSHESVGSAHIPGAFISNRRFDIPASGIHVYQIAPTILSCLDLDAPEEMEHPPLLLSDH